MTAAKPSYAPARLVVGQLLLLAGQGPLDVEGRLVGEGDTEAQAAQVFANIAEVLTAHGAGLADLVRLTIFVADRADIPAVQAVRARLLAPPYPAATIVVAGLIDPAWRLEVEATAALPQGSR
ncbi:MAG: RidA family protein [Sphingomonadaceae bacterium]|nr:RidA family protein [Sphingomonadaceae bacterium]